jgi:hypothetical protein
VINHGPTSSSSCDDFARAIAATDLPHDFTLDDLHWPLPGMVVAWPAGFMRETVGRDICYVYAANLDAGDHSVAACPAAPPSRSQSQSRLALLRDDGEHLASFVTAFHRDNPVDQAILRYGYTDYTGRRDEAGSRPTRR